MNISKTHVDLIPLIIEDGVLPKIINLAVDSKNKTIYLPAHELIACLTVTTERDIINYMLELDILTYFTQPLNSVSEELIKQTLFGISNISVDSQAAAGAILTHESLIYRMLTMMMHQLESIKKEATYAVFNTLATASEEVLRSFHLHYTREYIRPMVYSMEYFRQSTDKTFVLL